MGTFDGKMYYRQLVSEEHSKLQTSVIVLAATSSSSSDSITHSVRQSVRNQFLNFVAMCSFDHVSYIYMQANKYQSQNIEVCKVKKH